MYILHRPAKQTRIAGVLITLAAVLATGAVAGRHYLQFGTQLGPTPAAVVSHVYDTHSALKHVETNQFAFDLPKDWEAFPLPQATANAYSWRNTADNKGVRVITVYWDGAPANFAINRAVAVQSAGNRLESVGDVSDNCIDFTEHSKPSPTDTAPARWQNVPFVCDTGNYLRNVVGISSPDGLNTVKLRSAAGSAHTVFITYTDADASPNFGIFTSMLRSFELK